ncbi:MAG: response regulator [Candidatus Scalindua sp. AMX11]|nr:MAG: response regulator [Candidatus Scalindua sp.]NOG83097.1 response regulator [Planctomycetota bacterium]RZV75883.1 MAG: response regulator [Candidatus Scalindua sp. SCAELEC01]TDE64941.1 MAG: response regulator [Candidatus Scalindua sp. AMX11]
MRKKIMIVEDDKFFHDLYVSLLKDTDYEITSIFDVREAMRRLEEVKPDLIILDMLLDQITGDTFFRLIKNLPEYADIPVIIASGYPRRANEILKGLDKNLTFLNKMEVNEKLIDEINRKIG